MYSLADGLEKRSIFGRIFVEVSAYYPNRNHQHHNNYGDNPHNPDFRGLGLVLDFFDKAHICSLRSTKIYELTKGATS